jgi:hypothetical protein
MQVDTTIANEPGRLLQRAAQEYIRAVRTAPEDILPSLPDAVVETLRQVIAFDFGGKASAYTRRMVVTSEWFTRLDLALSAARLDENTAARVMRHVRQELDEKLPIKS